MPPDATVAMAHSDDLPGARHHSIGVQAVLKGAVEALALKPPAGGLVEEQDGAAAVVVLTTAVGEQRLDGEGWNGPLAHAGAGVVGQA